MGEALQQDDDDFGYDEDPGIGCYNCGGGGWRHGCIDDLCRGSNEPEECEFARPCPCCNPDGDVPW